MANYARDKDDIHKQLALAKETLSRLRRLNGEPNEREHTVESDGNLFVNGSACDELEDGEFFWQNTGQEMPQNGAVFGSVSDCGSSDSLSPTQGSNIASDKSKVARESLARVLGLQVSKLEDDLKISLLAYFEQMETQKEELIVSFETMHRQLLKHQQMCQEHHKESFENEAVIERLRNTKQTLEIEVEKLRLENVQLSATRTAGVENGRRHFVEHDELSETLMKENSRLREMLRKYETNDYARLERKVALQEKLCESYNKDISSKESVIKRVQAENRGLHEDLKNLQDEILKINANRISAEQDKTRLKQELQFCEEQITTLRERLANAAEEGRYLQRCINDANSKASSCDGNLSELEKEILALRERCDSYRDKLNDKDRFLASATKENHSLTRTLETMRKELAIVQGECRSSRAENQRLQQENADREIDRLSSETNSKASSSKISVMKQQMLDLQSKVDELETKRKVMEDREMELNKDVFVNLEKYTQAEQEVYLTKKELAQLRGFYDSSEQQRKHLQAEVDRTRSKVAELEKELHRKNLSNDAQGKHGVDELLRERAGLLEENQRLREEFQTNKTEINEVEEALQSAREQNTVQRMRLDAHETLTRRKDQRIKELQNELVERHNQCDALTDEILKRYRETEGLRTAKLLLEQEVDLLKSGKLSARSFHREATGKDGVSSYPSADPASPDSGFSDMEREKAIERLRKEILLHNKLHPQQPVLNVEHFAAGSLTDSGMRQTDVVREYEQRISNLGAENEILKQRERELKNSQTQLEEELCKVKRENRELKERQEILEKASGESKIVPTVNSRVQNLQTGLVEESLLQPSHFEGFEKMAVDEAVPEMNVLNLESVSQENLIEFADKIDGLRSECVRQENCRPRDETKKPERQIRIYEARSSAFITEENQLTSDLKHGQVTGKDINNNQGETGEEEMAKRKDETEKLQLRIQDDEACIKKMNAERERLLSDLKLAEENTRKMDEKCKSLQDDKKEMQKILEDKTEKLEKQIRDYETHLKEETAEKNQLLSKLKHAEENLREVESRGKGSDEDKKERQKIVLVQEEGLLSEGNFHLENNEDLEEKVQDYETRLKHVTAEKVQLLSELQQAQNDIGEIENERRKALEDKKQLEKIIQEKTEEVEKQFEVYKSRLKKAETEKDQMFSDLKYAQENIAEIETGRNKLQKDKEDLETALQNKNEELEKQIQNYESHLKKIVGEKDQLLLDLEEAKKHVEDIDAECQRSQEDKRELQKIMQEEIIAKDEEVTKLQNEVYVLCEDRASLQSSLDSFKEQSSLAAEEMTKVQKTIMDQVKKEEMSRDRENDLQWLLSQSEEKNSTLEDELANGKKERQKMEKQAQVLRQQANQAQQRSQELERDIADARRKLAETERKQKKTSDELTDLEEENEQLQTKLDEAHNTLEHLQDEKDLAVSKLQSSLRRKENEIQHLEDELSLSQQRYSEIKAISSDTQLELSDLQQQLIESRNQFFTVSQEKSRLLHSERELEQGMAEKEDKILVYEADRSEDKKTIAEQRKKVEQLVDKLSEAENAAGKLKEEIQSLQENLTQADQKQSQLKTLLKQSADDKVALEQQLSAAHESITDLEIAFERGEERTSQLTENLTEAKQRIGKLEEQLDVSQKECRTLEKERNETQKNLENTQAALETSQGKMENLEKKLHEQKENVSCLQMARDESRTSEQELQEKFSQAQEKIEKAEEENSVLKNKQIKLEKKLGDLISRHDKLEEKNENIEKINRELRKELELERDKHLTMQNDVESKQREKLAVIKKVELLEANIAETEEFHSRNMEEKSKLREELVRAKKNISDLEATKEAQEDTINDVEDLLKDTRGKMALLEHKLEDSVRDNSDLKGQLEELNRKLKYTKEENSDLEKRLQRQKEISDGFRSSLSEREEAIMSSDFNRDLAENALQSAKKELARKDANIKMQKEHIEDMEAESEKATKKLREAEAFGKKLTEENERLVKEFVELKERFTRMEMMKAENENLMSEMEPPWNAEEEENRVSVKTDRLIRDWSDKLSTAQIKITDLEKELIKDIKRQELKNSRTRPGAQERRRRNLNVEDADYGRPSRARLRPSRSRESSVDSIRSDASVFDFPELRITVDNGESSQSDNSVSVDQNRAASKGLDAGILNTRQAINEHRDVPAMKTMDKNEEGEEKNLERKSFEKEPTVEEGQTVLPGEAPFLNILKKEEDASVLQSDFHQPLLLESSTADLDFQSVLLDIEGPAMKTFKQGVDKLDQRRDPHQLLPLESSKVDFASQAVLPDTEVPTSNTTKKGVDATDSQSVPFKPLRIEPPTADMFQFDTDTSEISTLTPVTDITFRSSSADSLESPRIFTFDPSQNDASLLDPFEQLMRDIHENDLKGNEKGNNTRNDVGDDVNNSSTDGITETATTDLARGTGKHNERNTSTPRTVIGLAKSDVKNMTKQGDRVAPPIPANPGAPSKRVYPVAPNNPTNPVSQSKQVHPVHPPNPTHSVAPSRQVNPVSLPNPTYSVVSSEPVNPVLSPKKTYSVPPSKQVNPVVSLPQPNLVHPVAPSRKLKDKAQPAVIPRKDEKGREKKNSRKESDNKPYSVMIMVDDKIVDEKPSIETKKSKRASTHPREETTSPKEATINTGDTEVYKTPSEIRKELEMASRKGHQQERKQTTKQRKEHAHAPETKSSKYLVEANKTEVAAAQHMQGNEEEQEEMGKERVMKLIAAFEHH